LANQGIVDVPQWRRVIEISTGTDDSHNDIGDFIKDLLEQETDLDDKD
jgi:hypothetical protein